MVNSFALEVAAGITIRGHLFQPDTGLEQYPTLVICHGIPQARQTPNERDQGYQGLAQDFTAAGYLTVIFNFRGTGESSGNFDLWGWQQDLSAILDYLLRQPQVNPTDLTLLGFSGGAAVSCITAARRPEITRLFLLACPADFAFLFQQRDTPQLIQQGREIGLIRDSDFPQDPGAWHQDHQRFRPVDYIRAVAPRPLWIIHGSQDELVVPDHAERLYQAAGEGKKLVFIPEAPHQLRGFPGVFDYLLQELKDSRHHS